MADVIDGRQWLEDRLSALQSHLEASDSDEERATIEAEIESVQKQLREARRHLGRWLLWGGMPPRQ
jgi:hypothetical protein